MTATAAQISQVRRMCALAVGDTTYTDAVLTAMIIAYPLVDINGFDWWVMDYSTIPPTRIANVNWTETYDLMAAAADVYQEKAATLATKFDFGADGATYTLSQQHQQALYMARFYRSRRSMTTVKQTVSPRPGNTWLVNGPDGVDL